jgi:general secretion pathway protein D
VKITADESSNALLITGSRAAYDALNSIIRKLDIRRSQVFVEAEILDINVSNGFKFGSSVFGGAGSEDGTKTAVTWEGKQIAPLIVSQASGTTDRTGIAQAAQPFQNDLTIGILSGAKVNVPGIGEISPGALIKMIKTDSSSRVLSSPHILTSNNEKAKITVGEKLYYRTAEVSTSGTAVENVKNEDVDLSLDIKPNISHSNYVTMQIDLNANTGTINSESRLPSVNKRQTSQIVTVKNGQTVVISGLVQTTELEVYQKIPLLGDIPILGWLFRNTDRQKLKSNLMIFLTPHVVHGANDLAAIYQRKVEERDEILQKVYGTDFQGEDFYRLLPKKEDGIYQADAFDTIDREKRERRHRELMKDMGYEAQEIDQIKQKLDSDSEKPADDAGTLEKKEEESEPEVESDDEAATRKATFDAAQSGQKG